MGDLVERIPFDPAGRDQVGDIDRRPEIDPGPGGRQIRPNDLVGLGRSANIRRDDRHASPKRNERDPGLRLTQLAPGRRTDPAFREDRNDPALLQCPDRRAGRADVLAIAPHRNATPRLAKGTEKPVVVQLLGDHEAEQPSGGRLKEHVINAARVVADQERRATRGEWVRVDDLEPVPECAIERIERPVDPEHSLNIRSASSPTEEPGRHQDDQRETKRAPGGHGSFRLDSTRAVRGERQRPR